MRSTTNITLFSLAVVMTSTLSARAAEDAALSLVVNPRTGTASIKNDTSTSVNIDGYLLTAGSSVFNPGGWTKLTGNAAFPGWAPGPAEANRLGEANLNSSLGLVGGASLNLGSPYLAVTPTQIGQAEPEFKFEYHLAGGSSVEGDVVFAPDNNLVLLVNPTTGAASLQNQSLFNVNIDGLLITSPNHVLDPIGWQGLAEGGTAGWAAGAAESNRLGEGNLHGSTLLTAGGSPMAIGTPINPAMIHDETDLVFEYHVSGGGSITGGVAFLAAAAVPLTGDYNGDHKVDAADYTVWRDTLGSTTDLRANGNNTGASAGKIDQADYTTWKSNFGMGSGSGGGALSLAATSTAVPEPSSCLIGCTFGIALTAARRVRRTAAQSIRR